LWLWSALALGQLSVPLSAAEPSADETAIRENAQKYVAAFNAGDGAALAALWSPEAVYVDSDTGAELRGRAAIADHFAQRFAAATVRPQLSVMIGSVRFVTSDVAIEDGQAAVMLPSGEATETSYSAVSVKRDGVWLLDSVRETMLPPPPTAAQHLDPLAFLVGEWVDHSDGASVHSTYRWSANEAFLVQTFNVVVDGVVDLQGTQIIGWDPDRQRIRSWLFDSDGGFGEGVWEFDQDHWTIHQTSTLPDGRRASAINVLRPIDVDTVGWKSTARQAGGELLPSVDEFQIVRVSSSGGAPAGAGLSPVPGLSNPILRPAVAAPQPASIPAPAPARSPAVPTSTR
jgi:uncharacterized protein (TIGR02246 family)